VVLVEHVAMDNVYVSTTLVAALVNFVAQVPALLHLCLNSVEHVLVVDLVKLVAVVIHAPIYYLIIIIAVLVVMVAVWAGNALEELVSVLMTQVAHLVLFVVTMPV